MNKIIAICNQKGGTAKTTTAINLSAYLALLEKKILIIDIDPQGNATSGIGLEKDQIKKSTYHSIIEQAPLSEIIQNTQIENLRIAAANVDLTGAEVELVGVLGREYRLKKLLVEIVQEYDFIFIDCPPSLGLLTINALCSANSVLIPIQCEYYALEGLGQLVHTVNLVKDNINPNLDIEGVLLTMADYRTKLTNEVINETRAFFNEKVYNTVIPRNIKLSEAPGFGKPIVLYDKHSIGAQKYEEFAKEFLRRHFPEQSEAIIIKKKEVGLGEPT